MNVSPKIYLFSVSASLLACLLAVALFNAVIDNHGLVFNLNRRPSGKTFEPSEIRVLKRNLIYRRSDYESAVFGTSRALYGFDCSHAFFGGVNAINAAMPGITFQEMGEAVCHFITGQCSRKVLITLDYGSFVPSKEPFYHDFHREPAKHVSQSVNDLFITFLSVDTLVHGFNILDSGQKLYDRHGALDNHTVLARTLKQGDLHKSFKKAEARCAEFWGKSEKQSIDTSLLAKICREAKAREVELFWLFTPYHHHLVRFFKERDGLPAMLQWRREMAEQLLLLGESRIFAWDSCAVLGLGIDEIIQESAGKDLPLFFEMSHFSRRLGNMMLDRMQSGKHSSRDEAENMLLVRQDNLPGHLQSLNGIWKDL